MLRQLGREHAELAKPLNNLGEALSDLGDFDGAAARFEEALAIYRRTLSPDHTNTAKVENNLGEVLMRTGAWAAAYERCSRALLMRQARLGHFHADTLKVRTRGAWRLPVHSAFV